MGGSGGGGSGGRAGGTNGSASGGSDGGAAGSNGSGAGAGGESDTGGSGGSMATAGSGGSAGLQCGDEVCDEPTEFCCFSTTGGDIRRSCSAQGCNGVVARCISNADCGAGASCCYTHYMTDPLSGSTECREGSCPTVPVECAGPDECPAGKQCCGEVDFVAGSYKSVTCKDVGTYCGLANWSWVDAPPICRTEADCPPELPQCAASLLLPLFVCKLPPP